MFFEFSDRAEDPDGQGLHRQITFPNEGTFTQQRDAEQPSGAPAPHGRTEAAGTAEGLWNLFLPESEYGAGLTNYQLGSCEIMGQSPWAPESLTARRPIRATWQPSSATAMKRRRSSGSGLCWPRKVPSAFCMTEPEVASSDATNIQASIVRDGDEYVLNGNKWWASGGGDPRCKIYILWGKPTPGAEA